MRGMGKRNIFKAKTRFQNKLMLLVFFSMLIPTIIFGGGLYYLISRILDGAYQNGAQSLEVVVGIVLFPGIILFFVLIGLCLGIAYSVTNHMVGPLERIETDLENIIEGHKRGPILIRPSDYLNPLVNKINRILEKYTPDC